MLKDRAAQLYCPKGAYEEFENYVETTMRKTKLELTWIGKDKRPKLEPRILLEDPELSYHASQKYLKTMF